MRKIATLALLLTGISFASMAQESPKKGKDGQHRHANHKMISNKTPEEIAKAKTARMDSALKFTDAQREQVYALHLKQAKANKDMVEADKKNRMQRRQAMKASHEELNSILTPDQQKVLAERKAKHEGKDLNKRKVGSKSQKTEKHTERK